MSKLTKREREAFDCKGQELPVKWQYYTYTERWMWFRMEFEPWDEGWRLDLNLLGRGLVVGRWGYNEPWDNGRI